MKLKVLFMALTISMASSAFAQFFPGRAAVTVLPTEVTGQVFNPYYEPIICNGQVFGQTASGQILNSFFAQQIMPAGSYRYAYVVTNGFNPFVNGWANVQCRFARFF